MGDNFVRLAEHLWPAVPKVYYATGAHWSHQNPAALRRVTMLKLRRSVSLPIERFQPEDPYLEVADAIICVGNKWVASTYSSFSRPLFLIDEAYPDPPPQLPRRSPMERARNNFIWVGGNGVVHKGLDLLLEVFPDLPKQHLHIVGHVAKSSGFAMAYSEELRAPNVHLYGWISTRARRFLRIASESAFTIFPSCSEAASGSVITPMRLGVIPIITEEVGLDGPGEYLLKSDSIEEIRLAVISAAQGDPRQLSRLSERVRQESLVRYSTRAYEERLRLCISWLLKGRSSCEVNPVQRHGQKHRSRSGMDGAI